MYYCTNCRRTFASFPAAHNHELATEYDHLTIDAQAFGETLTRIEELVVCCLSDCRKAVRAAEAVYDESDDEAYCSLEHQAEGRLQRAIGLYTDDLS